MSSSSVATDRVTGSVSAMHEAPMPLGEGCHRGQPSGRRLPDRTGTRSRASRTCAPPQAMFASVPPRPDPAGARLLRLPRLYCPVRSWSSRGPTRRSVRWRRRSPEAAGSVDVRVLASGDHHGRRVDSGVLDAGGELLVLAGQDLVRSPGDKGGGRPLRSARFRLIRVSVNSMPVPPIQASRKNSSSSLPRVLSVPALVAMVSLAISRSHQGEIDTMAPGGCHRRP